MIIITKTKMKKKITIILLTISVLYSCSRENKPNHDNLEIYPLKEKRSEIKLNQLFSRFDFISLETTDEAFIGNVSKLIVNDDNIFILDNSKAKKIFIFNTNGKFVRTIGKIGKGPGEYTNIEDFTIDKKTGNIVVLTYPSIILVYNIEGDFVEQKKISKEALLWNIGSYKNGYICSSNHQSVLKGDNAFLLFNYTNDFKLKSKSVDVLSHQVTVPPLISNPLLNYQNQVAYFDFHTSSLYLGVNTSNLKRIHFNFEEKSVPEEVYANLQKFVMNQNKYSFFMDLVLTKDKMLSSFGSGGKLYVQILNLITFNNSVYEYNDWFPKLLYYNDGVIYSTMSALKFKKDYRSKLKEKGSIYPINENSNPVILMFNENNLIKNEE